MCISILFYHFSIVIERKKFTCSPKGLKLNTRLKVPHVNILIYKIHTERKKFKIYLNIPNSFKDNIGFSYFIVII